MGVSFRKAGGPVNYGLDLKIYIIEYLHKISKLIPSLLYIGSTLEDVCHPSKEVFFQFGVDETVLVVVTTPRISPGNLKWKPFGINKK